MELKDIIELKVDLQQILTAEQAWYYGIIPKRLTENQLDFYIDEENDNDISLKNELEVLFNKQINLVKVPSKSIQVTLGKYYRNVETRTKKSQLNIKNNDFLANLILEANSIKSSDIHFEPFEHNARIRFRIDGKLIERYIIEKEEYPSIINKIKIKANLDIAEKRLPQDGRILFNASGSQFDLRVSILPTLYGEKAVLRLLSKDATNIDLNSLGFSQSQLNSYLEGVKNPHGIVLVSGPTGSGKTTTLYATLKLLNAEDTNILTIEDPIEYTLPGINQVQLKESIGLTFASALRTFLRQDPDIIMLGEIRDGETAQMAIRASLTGHLVLSTIHTNSAWGIITRLIDMGVPSFLLASTINVVVAQRLVRKLCNKCKQEQQFEISSYPHGYKPTITIKTHFIAKGCEDCFYTGYKGRKAVYEIIPLDDQLITCIREGVSDISEILKKKNIVSMADQALILLSEGETTVNEIYSILKSKASE